MTPLGELIAKAISRKIISNMEAKKAEREAAIERGELSPPEKKPFANPFSNFWSLEDRKSTPQAIVTLLFFMAITAAMDFAIIFMFSGGEEYAGVRHYLMRFPPSFFVGVGLTVLVMLTRDIPGYMKAVMVGISVGCGYAIGSIIAILPLAWLLRQPVKGEKADAPVREESIAAQDAPQEDGAPSAPEKPEEAAEEQAEETDPEGPKLPGDAERPDDYVDPIKEFLKKD